MINFNIRCVFCKLEWVVKSSHHKRNLKNEVGPWSPRKEFQKKKVQKIQKKRKRKTVRKNRYNKQNKVGGDRET